MSGLAATIASEFLSLVWDGSPPDEPTLLAGLDKLLAKSHDVAMEDCAEEERDPPSVDGPALYREVAARFPELGMYPVSDPLADIGDDRMMADAIDDIADLTRDLREVVWRDANTDSSDAAWYFRLMHSHWGSHARNLAVYLHERNR